MAGSERVRIEVALRRFIGVVTVSAAIAMTSVAMWLPVSIESRGWTTFAIFAALLGLCELRPITVVRAGGMDQIVSSTTFAFAIFLSFGAVPALAAQVVASLLADLAQRKSPQKALFNVSQYGLAWSLAAIAHHLVLGSSVGLAADTVLTWRWAAAAAAAAITFYLANGVLIGLVVAISAGSPAREYVVKSLRNEATSNLVLLALSPIVVIVADRSLWVLPLLLLPVLDVYHSAAVSAAKDHQSRHDSLTGLPNRMSFLADVERRLVNGRGQAAVLLIDLDHFKEVNDTLGHQAGDELLCQVGPRIASGLPAGSTVARLGGDEFAVLVPALSDAAQARSCGEQIADALRSPFEVEGFHLEVAGSVGVAIFPRDGKTTETLLKCADIAMYVAKGAMHAVELYDPEADHHSTRRLELMSQLRAAIEAGDVIVNLQPKLDLRTGRIHALEALVRWVHPQLGTIPPGEFVPLAEHTGLIQPLTSHVLRLALDVARALEQVGHVVPVAVNLSTRSLHDAQIVEEVRALLAQPNTRASMLQLEITESSIMADPQQAGTVLRALADLGVHLAIDDFGTGYSSLAYLQELPVSEIKIDRSFVMNMMESEADQVIVRSTIELARNLGFTSTAEGVESEAALRWLVDAGCDHAQGYHIARPMPADDVAPWLAAHLPAIHGSEPGSVVRLFPPRGTRRAGGQ